MKKYSCAAATKTGRRQNNQDNYMLAGRFAPLEHGHSADSCGGKTDKPFFAAVCDGMGGEASGERASFEVCSVLADAAGGLGDSFEANKAAAGRAILRANERICDIMRGGDTGRMGSTLTAVLLQDDRLYYTNLGDSRIYLLRKGKLYQLTKDHTEGQTMVDAGLLTAEQLKTHPSRNKLSLHLGIFPEEVALEPAEYADLRLSDGDRFLLCSDGVYGALGEEELASVLGGSETAEERAEKLVDRAYANGSRDNMTALVIDVSAARKLLLPIIIAVGIIAAAAAVLLIRLPGGKNRWESSPQKEPITLSPEESAQPSETASGDRGGE